MKNIPLILFLILLFLIVKKRFFDFTDYKSLLEEGGVIIDVRSNAEFASGNIENSINIPLSEINNVDKLIDNKEQNIITCCASGMRSATAKNILKAKGYNNVINGGGWSHLNSKIKK